jgi:hypothetical protein
MPPRPRLFAGLLAHQAHRKRRIARYQMLCRVARRADRALVFATLESISDFVIESRREPPIVVGRQQ